MSFSIHSLLSSKSNPLSSPLPAWSSRLSCRSIMSSPWKMNFFLHLIIIKNAFHAQVKGKTNANQTISLLVHKRLILSPTYISTSTFTSISTSTQKVLHQKETREVVQTRKEDSSSSSSSGGIVIGV